MSEHERPSVYSGTGFRVDELTDGFFVSRKGVSFHDTEFSCSACKAVAG